MTALVRYITSGAWAMHRPTLDKFVNVVHRHMGRVKLTPEEVQAIVADRDGRKAALLDAPADATKPYYINGTVAVVPIEGVIARHASMVGGVSQPEGMSCGQIIDAMNAAADSGAKSILLDINSPGGMVSGIDDVVQAVREVGQRIPVVACSHDLMASAAYWVGSQARELFLGPVSAVGSIGVYEVVDDTSEAFAESGVRRLVIKKGRHKALGMDGVPVSEEDAAVLEAELDGVYRAFIKDVAHGRGVAFERSAKWADGRVHTGADAVVAGLADGVMSFSNVLRHMELTYGDAASVATVASTQSPIGAAANRPAVAEKSAMTKEQLLAAYPDVMGAYAADARAAARAEFDEEKEEEAKAKAAEEDEEEDDEPAAKSKKSKAKKAEDEEDEEEMAEDEEDDEKPAALKALRAATPTSLANGDALVLDSLEKGRSLAQHAAAVAKAVDAQPKARAKGADPVAHSTKTPAGTHPFMAAVEKLIAAGSTRADAIRAVAIKRPDLHSEYIEHINS